MSRLHRADDSEDEILETPASRRYLQTPGGYLGFPSKSSGPGASEKLKVTTSPRKSLLSTTGLQKSAKTQRPLGAVSANPLLLPLGKRGGEAKFGEFGSIDLPDLPKPKSPNKSRSSLRKPSPKKAELSESDESFEENSIEEDLVVPTTPVTSRSSPRKAAKQKIDYQIPDEVSDSEESEEEFVEESSEDEFHDFIVEDSASESELDQPPKSSKKSNNSRSKGRRNPKEDLKSAEDISVTRAADLVCLDSPEAIPQKATNRPMTSSRNPLDDFFEDPSSTLKFSPSPIKPSQKKFENNATPPQSPSRRGVPSFSQPGATRIPPSPHRQSNNEFWSQESTNEWVDQHSPQRPTKTRQPLLDDSDSDIPSPSASPRKGPPETSKSKKSRADSPVKKDKSVAERKKAFSNVKATLGQSFLDELDSKITGCKIAELAESTGGVKIIWSKTLKKTAGRANWKRQSDRSRSLDGTITTLIKHHASIELAEKVIDDEDRLLNTLAHEFCHLANFMISGVKDQPHGKEFKAWAAKTTSLFADRGVEVTTKHNYAIDYRYVWECVECGVEYKRHSKSIDLKRHSCGKCKGHLEQTKPVPRGKGKSDATATAYQAFVKSNYARVKESLPVTEQKNIGKIMAAIAKEYKLSQGAGEGLAGAAKEDKVETSWNALSLGKVDEDLVQLVVEDSDDMTDKLNTLKIRD